jgi:hypothetical protein
MLSYSGATTTANRGYTAGECEGVGEEAFVDFTGTWNVVSSSDFDDD